MKHPDNLLHVATFEIGATGHRQTLWTDLSGAYYVTVEDRSSKGFTEPAPISPLCAWAIAQAWDALADRTGGHFVQMNVQSMDVVYGWAKKQGWPERST